MQLALPVTLPDDETFASFYGGENSQVVHYLDQLMLSEPEDFSFTYLCGLGDSGKSHLLYASCIRAAELGLSNFRVPLSEVLALGPGVMEGLEQCDLICIDDLQLIAGDKVWENALFNFFNLFNQPGKRLLVAADLLPDALNIQLPDLVSRLKWGTTFQIRSICDDDKAELLVQRAHLRGLELTSEASRFLLTRLSRDMRTLLEVLDRLDQYSVTHQRKLTIPFIKEMLDL